MKRLGSMLAGLALACVARPALCAPPLEATALYKTIAHGCRSLDLKQWSHPTRRALEKARIHLAKVELCNDDLYPIFTVSFPYDPDGATDSYFNKLYVAIAAANGYRPYSFVDPRDGLVINVGVAGKKEVSVEYEDYAAGEKR